MDVTPTSFAEHVVAFTSGLGAHTGQSFLNKFVELGAHLLDAECFYIGLFQANNSVKNAPKGGQVVTAAVFKYGEVVSNFQFSVRGSPWEKVLTGEPCRFWSGALEPFPQDLRLVEIEASAYVGYPVFDDDGLVFAIVAGMSSRPLASTATHDLVLQAFLPRIAGELLRTQSDAKEREELARRLQRTECYVEVANSTELVLTTEMDLRTGRIRTDGNAEPLFGCAELPNFFDDHAWQQMIPEDFEQLTRTFRDALQRRMPFSAIYRVLRPDGDKRWISARGRFSYDDIGQPVSVALVNFDITVEKTLESKLRHSQRLAAIGEVAAGIAHEVNNPLAIIQGTAQQLARLIKTRGMSREDLLRRLEMIVTATTRMADVVASLKGFARADSDEVKALDANVATGEVIQFFAPVYEQIGIKLRFVGLEYPVLIQGCRDRYTQLVMNLISNARDAVAESEQKNIDVELSDRGDEICLVVADTGAGIAEQELQKVFEPFYTTKPAGKGLGLGLSICQTIVQEMKGVLRVSSELGRGTQFVVALPRLPGVLSD